MNASEYQAATRSAAASARAGNAMAWMYLRRERVMLHLLGGARELWSDVSYGFYLRRDSLDAGPVRQRSLALVAPSEVEARRGRPGAGDSKRREGRARAAWLDHRHDYDTQPVRYDLENQPHHRDLAAEWQDRQVHHYRNGPGGVQAPAQSARRCQEKHQPQDHGCPSGQASRQNAGDRLANESGGCSFVVLPCVRKAKVAPDTADHAEFIRHGTENFVEIRKGDRYGSGSSEEHEATNDIEAGDAHAAPTCSGAG
jgi:hypothetical protein